MIVSMGKGMGRFSLGDVDDDEVIGFGCGYLSSHGSRSLSIHGYVRAGLLMNKGQFVCHDCR